MSYNSREDFAAQVDWEGGVYRSLEYGVRTDDVPEGDYELQEAWQALQELFLQAEPCANRVYDLLFGQRDH